MTRTAASKTALQSIKDVTLMDALRIRRIWKEDFIESEPDLVREYERTMANAGWQSANYIRQWCIDRILNTHGVEFLGKHKRTGRDVEYCNAGDTYATTVLFIGDRLVVGCWGDLVEADLIRDVNDY